jgi:type IV pilus assembly protein PilC
MATAAAAAPAKAKGPKEVTFTWEGKDKAGKVVRGEMRATGEALVNATLRRQGIIITKVKQQRLRRGGSVGEKDLALFTRQLATMMKAGVPLLQSFEIVAKGPPIPRWRGDRHQDRDRLGAALAFRYLLYFDAPFCNLVGAAAGILETLLDRLATYKEKIWPSSRRSRRRCSTRWRSSASRSSSPRSS